MKSRGYFITGTDTGVGKTYAAVALCRAFASEGLRVGAMKPVASGCRQTTEGLRNDDALALQAAANVELPYKVINPFTFEPAIAPHIAARMSEQRIDLAVLDSGFERIRETAEIVIVEGAGGWLTPLDETRSLAELPARWKLEVILVVGLRLGCLNHALLTTHAIEASHAKLSGWIANSIDPNFAHAEENFDYLRTHIGAPCVGLLSHRAARDDAARSLNLERLLPAAG